jgi:hypothetical protein
MGKKMHVILKEQLQRCVGVCFASLHQTARAPDLQSFTTPDWLLIFVRTGDALPLATYCALKLQSKRNPLQLMNIYAW